MDATLKARWIEALRSGLYRQGQAKLYQKKSNAYCCLGVLCVVMGKDIRYDWPYKVVPAEYRNLLMEMNDGGQFTFPQIADYIEKEL